MGAASVARCDVAPGFAPASLFKENTFSHAVSRRVTVQGERFDSKNIFARAERDRPVACRQDDVEPHQDRADAVHLLHDFRSRPARHRRECL